ncbi:flagellar hook-length control protein FliK [Ferrimonas sp. SCSIO 43195]|uniref:flagellar hook-length control protein FliK n=1 Tax=Ferrimonas sp. SCSIO 43195 TaxID=2822844 RepID=UPI002074BFF7|nr:flagellar hook-length control protein FliK [Ferrimonas sp. SCSIO 43195]USD38631.1 flagellar hook-length control protein FliK [Ferrimonas sp. SCSIO 43195]
MDARLTVNTSSSVLGPTATPAAEAQGEGFGAALASASQQQSGDRATSSQAPVATESPEAESGVKSPSQTDDANAKPEVAATETKGGDAAPSSTNASDNGDQTKMADGETAAKSGKDSLNPANLLQPGRQQPASAITGEDNEAEVEGRPQTEATPVGNDDSHPQTSASEQAKAAQSASTDTKPQADDAPVLAATKGSATPVEASVPEEAPGLAVAAGAASDLKPVETSGQGASEAVTAASAKPEDGDSDSDPEAEADTKTAVAAGSTDPQPSTVAGSDDAKTSDSPFAGLAQANAAPAPTPAQDDGGGDPAQSQAASSVSKATDPHGVAAAAQTLVSRPAQAAKVAGEGTQATSGADSVPVTQAKGSAEAGSSDGDASAGGDKANGELLAQLQGFKQAQDKLSSAPKGRMAASASGAEGGSTTTTTAPQLTGSDADADPLAKWANDLVKADAGASAGRTTATLTADAALPTADTQLANSAAAVEAAEAAELDLDPQLRLQQARTPEARVQAHQQLQHDPAAALRQPVAAERMAPELRERMMMMINSRTSQAEIRLDPPELGALQVKIQMNGDQAQVQMHAAQAQTREMVEQALPRLREMLAQQGITLADTHISHGSGGQAGNEAGDGQGQHGQQGFGDGMVEASDDTLAAVQQMTGRNADGGIDYYA